MTNLKAYPILCDRYETRPGCGSLESCWRVWTPFETPHVVGEYLTKDGAQALADFINSRAMKSVVTACPKCGAEIMTLPGVEPPPTWHCANCGERFELLSTIAGIVAVAHKPKTENPTTSYSPNQLELF